MKYFFGAILMLMFGYGIAIFVPPSNFEFLNSAKNEIENNLTTDIVPNIKAKLIDPSTQASKTENPHKKTAADLAGEGYQQETDLLQVPGLGGVRTLRIGPPTTVSEADHLILQLPSGLDPLKLRFLTATASQRVQVLAGQFIDSDTAWLNLRKFQPAFDVQLEVVFIPKCALDTQPDANGFVCIPEPAEDST